MWRAPPRGISSRSTRWTAWKPGPTTPRPWVGFSKQVVEVTVYSQSRKRAADMTNVLHMTLNGYRGQRAAPNPAPDDATPNDLHPPVVQACLLDSVMENFEEDSSFYAVSLFFNVQISAA